MIIGRNNPERSPLNTHLTQELLTHIEFNQVCNGKLFLDWDDQVSHNFTHIPWTLSFYDCKVIENKVKSCV
jgi:hypothetical protein